MDVLSEVLRGIRMEAALYYNAEFSAPWGFRAPASCALASYLGPKPRHVIIFHLLTEGRADAEVENGERVGLSAGDIVVFPHGDPHIIKNGSPAQLINTEPVMGQMLSSELRLARIAGTGPKTCFVCGYMSCEPELGKVFLAGLPPIFKVNIRNDMAGQWIENSIKFSASEANRRPGSEVVMAKVSEALFVETLRRYMAELSSDQTGWLAGARDTVVGLALGHLHRDPARGWTIADLAQEVGVSRSVLADRFRYFLGEPPITYLSRWRLQLGAQLLRSTSRSVAQIAGEVGYESEPAFNRAFKREFGLPPARYRSGAKASPVGTSK